MALSQRRNSSIELLRILAILMIIGHHFAIHSQIAGAIEFKFFKRKNPLAEKKASLCAALTSDASQPPSSSRRSSNDVK